MVFVLPDDDSILYLDNFGTTRIQISRNEHESNVRFLQDVLAVYYEFPALYNVCGEKEIGVAGNRSCLSATQATGSGTMIWNQNRRTLLLTL